MIQHQVLILLISTISSSWNNKSQNNIGKTFENFHTEFNIWLDSYWISVLSIFQDLLFFSYEYDSKLAIGFGENNQWEIEILEKTNSKWFTTFFKMLHRHNKKYFFMMCFERFGKKPVGCNFSLWEKLLQFQYHVRL